MANLGCNLECVDGKAEGADTVEFVGPVKIVLVNQSKKTYCGKTCHAAFIVLAEMVIAISFLFVAIYSLTYNKETFMQGLHIFLGTIGLQLLFPMGVLNLNNLSGGAAPMKLSHRKFEHGFLQIFGLGTSVAGSVLSYFSNYSTIFTVHSCFGYAATGSAILSGMIGILVYLIWNLIFNGNVCSKLGNIFITSHRILGVLTIVLSSMCFISGILQESFTDWLPLHEIFFCLPIFCGFYTAVVIYKPLSLIIL